MSCRTSHRAICSERHGRNTPFCSRPERRRRPRVCTQQRGRHPSSARRRRAETHVHQILRHDGRAILSHHDRRSISTDDSVFAHHRTSCQTRPTSASMVWPENLCRPSKISIRGVKLDSGFSCRFPHHTSPVPSHARFYIYSHTQRNSKQKSNR